MEQLVQDLTADQLKELMEIAKEKHNRLVHTQRMKELGDTRYKIEFVSFTEHIGARELNLTIQFEGKQTAEVKMIIRYYDGYHHEYGIEADGFANYAFTPNCDFYEYYPSHLESDFYVNIFTVLMGESPGDKFLFDEPSPVMLKMLEFASGAFEISSVDDNSFYLDGVRMTVDNRTLYKNDRKPYRLEFSKQCLKDIHTLFSFLLTPEENFCLCEGSEYCCKNCNHTVCTDCGVEVDCEIYCRDCLRNCSGCGTYTVKVKTCDACIVKFKQILRECTDELYFPRYTRANLVKPLPDNPALLKWMVEMSIVVR